jgi:hypothetical protein
MPTTPAAPAAGPSNPFAGLDETSLFKMLTTALKGQTVQPRAPIMGAYGMGQGFAPGTAGHTLQMLFGGGLGAPQAPNPNDVNFREGGVSANMNEQSSAETPSQYFARMSAMAMGGGAPAAPGATPTPMSPSGKPVVTPKPVAIKPVAKVKPSTAAIPTQSYTAPDPAPAPAATSVGFQAADTYKAPEPVTPVS